ncbi:FAD-dependent monooxygenase [Embleya scabrispora]|uniref:FAD-dependent monooxygenase n=1 Tax=Embleya scabrispora TaxID=159449 RepID=UPI00038172EB|nr:FAD-dependent monooxygenase [Embleya scabrispora]MYS82320.1 flavin-dependent oxidoreductase [Streptomyces sp. SID5474]
MRVVVAGAGIGGLATALSLHAAGITDVTVYEAVEEIRPFGVGIDLLPHAVRELTELGLYDDVAEISVATAESVLHDRFGNRIRSEPRGLAAGYAWPQFSVHRGELQMLLLRAQLAWLGAESLRTGLRLSGYAQTADGVTVEFTDPAGNTVTDEADVLIAADGIDSAGRALMYPSEGPPTWHGRILWRGVSPAPALLTGHTTIVAGDDDQTFVARPLRAAEGERPALLTWLAERPHPGPPVQPGDWQRPAELDTILAHFADWEFDWLDVPALIANADVAYEYPVVDRDPLPSWSDGRVTLLGDAAHATFPIGIDGASQAILDARVLAHELATHTDPIEALTRYEELRRPAMTTPQHTNRTCGPGTHPAPAPGTGHDAETLNNRASYSVTDNETPTEG